MGDTRPLQGESADADWRYPYTPDELRSIAARPIHRAILVSLSVGGPLDVGDLATHVAARRNDVVVADVTADQRRRSLTSLHHRDLEPLVREGLVEYDGDRLSLDLRGSARVDAIQRLDASPAADERWEALATILGDERRECAVELLVEEAGPVSLVDLATSQAMRETGGRPGAVSRLRRECPARSPPRPPPEARRGRRRRLRPRDSDGHAGPSASPVRRSDGRHLQGRHEVTSAWQAPRRSSARTVDPKGTWDVALERRQ